MIFTDLCDFLRLQERHKIAHTTVKFFLLCCLGQMAVSRVLVSATLTSPESLVSPGYAGIWWPLVHPVLQEHPIDYPGQLSLF